MRFIAFLVTLIGVPAGLAMTDGNVRPVYTGPLALTLALLTLLLPRFPLSVLIVSELIMAAQRGSYLVGSGWVWPATAALVALVLADRLRVAAVTASIGLLYGFGWDAVVDRQHHGASWSLAHIGGEALWVIAVLAVTTAYRNTRRWQREVAARLVQDQHEVELEARRRRAEERVEIARDLHDVVSHTLAVVGVHLNVALDAFDAEPDEARASLRLAQDVRGQAMTDLRALVGVLRDGSPRDAVTPGLDGLDQLAEQVRAAGLTVTVTEFGEREPVPAPVATAVYRVVQESLSNTVRHAEATHVAITARYDESQVTVDVRDDGRGTEAVTEGHGISGMRERVAALGGDLTATADTEGFTVRATIPVSA